MWAPGRATRGAGGQPAGDEAESPSHVLWREEAAGVNYTRHSISLCTSPRACQGDAPPGASPELLRWWAVKTAQHVLAAPRLPATPGPDGGHHRRLTNVATSYCPSFPLIMSKGMADADGHSPQESKPGGDTARGAGRTGRFCGSEQGPPPPLASRPRTPGQRRLVLPFRGGFLLLHGRDAKILGGISQPEALRHVAEVEQANVEDVLQLPGVGGVGADEGLQGWKGSEVREAVRAAERQARPSRVPVLRSSPPS